LDRYLIKEIAWIYHNLGLTKKEHQKIHGTITKMDLKFLHKAIDKILIWLVETRSIKQIIILNIIKTGLKVAWIMKLHPISVLLSPL
jgi:hypothetical protein